MGEPLMNKPLPLSFKFGTLTYSLEHIQHQSHDPKKGLVTKLESPRNDRKDQLRFRSNF